MFTESNRYAVRKRSCLWGLAGILLLFCTLPLGAQTTVTPQTRAPLSVTTVLIDGSAGAQTDPHVSQNLAAYTDGPSGQIRYYDFGTGIDSAISNVLPSGEVTIDFLSDVSGTNIVFTRLTSAGSDVEIFNTASATLTTLDPASNPNRAGAAIGGNTVAYTDSNLPGALSPELIVHDLVANTAILLTNDVLIDQNPQVSPNGQVVVWQSCTPAACNISQAFLAGASWIISAVTNTPESNNRPHTDGVNVVYDSNRATSVGGSDIYFRQIDSSPEVQIALAGVQTNPSIAAGIIAFQSSADGASPNDLLVYRISSNELFQVTNTPTISEILNDVTVLPNGDVRLVWSTGGGEADVLATTFTLPPPAATYNFTGFFQPVDNLPTINTAKAGSAIPVKFSLGGYQGLDIIATGFPGSQQIFCNTSEPTDQIEQTVTAGSSSLSYDATSDQYNYVWKTDKSWVGTCRQLMVKLKDGSSHSANFELTK